MSTGESFLNLFLSIYEFKKENVYLRIAFDTIYDTYIISNIQFELILYKYR